MRKGGVGEDFLHMAHDRDLSLTVLQGVEHFLDGEGWLSDSRIWPYRVLYVWSHNAQYSGLKTVWTINSKRLTVVDNG